MLRPKSPFVTSKQLARRLTAGSIALGVTACYSTGEGLDPPVDRVYYPVGLALGNDARHLVVVNSDYDLQYNAGTLQVLDVEVLRGFAPQPCSSDAQCGDGRRCDTLPTSENRQIPSFYCVATEGETAGQPCGLLGERSSSDQLLHPGRCQRVLPDRLPGGGSAITTAVRIGAFATDVVHRSRPAWAPAGPPGRIFFPVRGDATLHWAELLEDGRIDCGQDNNGGACDDRHRVGDDPDRENTRDLRLSPEPYGVDASPDGQVLVVTHQTGDNVALFVNDWSDRGPRLEHELGRLGGRPVDVAALPTPAVAMARGMAYAPGFLVTFRAADYVSLVRYVDDVGAAPERPYLAPAGASPIVVNSVGTDSRGIAVDSSSRRAAEQRCAADLGIASACLESAECVLGLADELRAPLIACLEGAAVQPLDVFVANRAPESLLVGRTRPAIDAMFNTELPTFYDSVPLPLGPSRVAVGEVIVGGEGENLTREPRVFITCFDSRRLIIYNPRERRVEARVLTGRGPHAVAVDSRHGLLFLGHFTDSYIGVVSIDARYPETYGTMIATIGQPSPPRASE